MSFAFRILASGMYGENMNSLGRECMDKAILWMSRALKLHGFGLLVLRFIALHHDSEAMVSTPFCELAGVASSKT